MIALIVLAVAAAQWIVFVIISASSRAAHPKSGLRAHERNLIVSTALLFAAWLVAFDARALLRSKPKAETASTVTTYAGSGSCASIQTGMSATDVATKLGKPDDVRNDEKTRGPGAATWIYRGSRCAVHILDERVEMVE